MDRTLSFFAALTLVLAIPATATAVRESPRSDESAAPISSRADARHAAPAVLAQGRCFRVATRFECY